MLFHTGELSWACNLILIVLEILARRTHLAYAGLVTTLRSPVHHLRVDNLLHLSQFTAVGEDVRHPTIRLNIVGPDHPLVALLARHKFSNHRGVLGVNGLLVAIRAPDGLWLQSML